MSRLISKKIDNCYVTTCKTASEALTLISEKKFNLVTSSLNLPDTDGINFAREIRSIATYKKLPFIIVSGNANSQITTQGFDAGVTGFFDKAYGHNALISYIESLLPEEKQFSAKILYVEDSKTAALRLNRLLDKHGYNVVHTDTAEHAYELLSYNITGIPNFDIIVTDITLNGEMTGYDLVKNIRGRLHYSPAILPIIMASSDESNINDVLACGANDFIRKPIHEELFCIRLKGLLAVRDHEQLKLLEKHDKRLFN